MATGDTNNILTRINASLPPWFPDLANAPVLTAVLTGIADAFAFCYSYLSFAALQTRLGTMTGGWLDLAAWDFFGSRFLRFTGEQDAAWQARIIAEIRRPRQTKIAIANALTSLTGRKATVLEFWHAGDMATYNTGASGWGVGKGYGSLQYPNTVFIKAFRTPNQGIALISGYATAAGGYGVGASAYVTLNLQTGQVTDATIYQTVANNVAAGITPWTALSN